jgi:hypothetical protein
MKLTMAQVIAFLQPFEAMLKPELLSLETEGKAELDAIIQKVSSPDLKALLSALDGALDQFAQVEINKLP